MRRDKMGNGRPVNNKWIETDFLIGSKNSLDSTEWVHLWLFIDLEVLWQQNRHGFEVFFCQKLCQNLCQKILWFRWTTAWKNSRQNCHGFEGFFCRKLCQNLCQKISWNRWTTTAWKNSRQNRHGFEVFFAGNCVKIYVKKFRETGLEKFGEHFTNSSSSAKGHGIYNLEVHQDLSRTISQKFWQKQSQQI